MVTVVSTISARSLLSTSGGQQRRLLGISPVGISGLISRQYFNTTGRVTATTYTWTAKKISYKIPKVYLPPWLSGLAISGRGAVKAWLAIRQGMGSYPTPAGMSSQVCA